MNLTASNTAQLAQLRNRTSRRAFLRNAAVAGVAAAPVASSLLAPSSAKAQTTTFTDTDILNFALNLEYLEAEFYAKAYYGVGLVELGVFDSTVRTNPGVLYPQQSTRVNFTNPFVYNYAAEIANDEIAHVSYLRQTLGDAAVQEPVIDLSENAFGMAAFAAGLGDSFNPFESEENFLLAAFIFEDVGATAYHGAAGLISNKDFIPPATGIYSVECYHAAIIRTTLFNLNYGTDGTLAQYVNAISQLRDALDGAPATTEVTDADDDQGITNADGSANIVPANSDGLIYARTTRQVLNIVYGAPNASKGLFFPQGMTGNITK